MRPDLFKNLPSEITTNILLRLPVRSIAISKCVCKAWLHLLETDHFVKSHLAKSTPALAFNLWSWGSNWFHVYELEEDELDLDHRYDSLTRFDFSRKAKIGGSANGLLFLYDLDRGNDALYVCNPITREFCLLRCPPAAKTYGFGVSRISGQYKVVAIEATRFDETRFMCHVYTLGTGSWRRVEATDSFDWSFNTVGAFVHGNLHWMVASDPIERISCFDLETECFSSFTVPLSRTRKMSRRLFTLGISMSGRLFTLRDSIGFCDDSAGADGIAIWMMKEYGNEKSWSIEYVITLNLDPDLDDPLLLLHPIKVFKNGDVLMFAAAEGFMHYSNKTNTVREIGGFFGATQDFYYIHALLVTPSMVSLKCFTDMENVISF